MKINNIAPDKHNYFQIISTIAQPVKCLYYIGNLPAERVATVAVVGTRKMTTYGQEVSYQITYELAKQGVVIVSGLAIGTDALAHQAALDAGGATIAVLPCGLDRIYPARHRQLALRILQNGGALISEFAAETPVYPINFISRNRIVSGLSDALLVTEAATKSGTLHTANFALEQGKTVMAIPGNINSPMSIGCNNLIKAGAAPVTSASDVLHELGFNTKKRQAKLPLADNPAEAALLKLLVSGTHDAEDLQVGSGLEPALFNQTLSFLEISGKIRPLGANKWSLY